MQASLPDGLAVAVMWDLGANVWLLGEDFCKAMFPTQSRSLDLAFSCSSWLRSPGGAPQRMYGSASDQLKGLPVSNMPQLVLFPVQLGVDRRSLQVARIDCSCRPSRHVAVDAASLCRARML